MEKIEKIFELNEEELEDIFSKIPIEKVETIVNKIKEVKEND